MRISCNTGIRDLRIGAFRLLVSMLWSAQVLVCEQVIPGMQIDGLLPCRPSFFWFMLSEGRESLSWSYHA